MRKRRFVSLSQDAPWFVLTCTLLLAACDPGSGDTLKELPADGGNSASDLQALSPASLSPFENLSDDTLIPPEQPPLSLSANTGTLNFSWQPLEGQSRARLFLHDPQTGGESLTHEFDDPTADNWQLPSQTHARPWHRQQYRVELCTADDCVSSPRVPLAGLAPYTVDALSPAVFVEAERYAEQIALNQTATLAVLSLPVEGALEFQMRIAGQWILTQRLQLDALDIASTRTLDIALSDTGDTVAILVQDSSDPTENTIRVLERLGESWVETAAWPATTTMAVEERTSVDGQSVSDWPDTALTLSSDGTQLLLHSDQTLVAFRQTESGWSEEPYPLFSKETPGATGTDTPTRLMASAPDAEFSRVFTLVEENQQLYLGVWTPSADAMSWQHHTAFPIQGPSPNATLSIISNTTGSSVIVAGWEDISSQRRAPVIWRYSVDPSFAGTQSDPMFDFSVTDSLRAPPTEHASPALIFTADASLTLIALGWHSAEETNSLSAMLPDAALSTYVFDTGTRQWFSALELPESLPTLAKQSFGAEIVVSADGSTMMLTRIAGYTDSSGARVGNVLVMR